jgi:hypothetical protein
MNAHPYLGRNIALTSRHEKVKLIRPAFAELVGCNIFEVPADTDQLGTFTGEIERKYSPHETAVMKARLGMRESQTPIGIASEGSIGPDPAIPFINSNIEHMVLVDDEQGIVISETHRSLKIVTASIRVSPGQTLEEYLLRADFPNHKLIVRSEGDGPFKCVKGIDNLASLVDAIRECSQFSASNSAIIEPDFRAMNSPSRQATIQAVARKLAVRTSQQCPQCHCPGWGRVGYEQGLICSGCGNESEEAIRQEKLGCKKCDFLAPGIIVAMELDPARCPYCNP